jgi:DoxX-like family
MARKITYWVATVLIATSSLFAGFAYRSGSPQAVQGFAHVGYPQHLRIILGIAKPLGAIVLLVQGVPFGVHFFEGGSMNRRRLLWRGLCSSLR